MRFRFKNIGLAALGLFTLAIIFIFMYFVLPAPPQGESSQVLDFLGTSVPILIVLGGALIAIMNILSIIEVLTSKNDIWYKIMWAVLLLLFGILSLVLYLAFARRYLK